MIYFYICEIIESISKIYRDSLKVYILPYIIIY